MYASHAFHFLDFFNGFNADSKPLFLLRLRIAGIG